MSTAKPTDFSCILKVSKQQLGTKPYQVRRVFTKSVYCPLLYAFSRGKFFCTASQRFTTWLQLDEGLFFSTFHQRPLVFSPLSQPSLSRSLPENFTKIRKSQFSSKFSEWSPEYCKSFHRNRHRAERFLAKQDLKRNCFPCFFRTFFGLDCFFLWKWRSRRKFTVKTVFHCS